MKVQIVVGGIEHTIDAPPEVIMRGCRGCRMTFPTKADVWHDPDCPLAALAIEAYARDTISFAFKNEPEIRE